MIHVWMRPPASLVHPRESLEHFWSSMQDKMQHFGDHIGDNVHSLHDTLHLRIGPSMHLWLSRHSRRSRICVFLGVLHDSMHESLSTIQSQLHENLEHARDSFQLTMEPFANRLHKSDAHRIQCRCEGMWGVGCLLPCLMSCITSKDIWAAETDPFRTRLRQCGAT